MADATDEALMDRYCAGDTAAFSALFRRYARRLVRFVTPYTGPAAAEDCVQHVFLKLHTSRGSFKVGARVKPWLFTIARNQAIDHTRSAPRRREVHDGDAHAATVGVDARVRDLGLDESVRAAIAALPADQRDVVTLHWLGALSFPEVASVVGASHEAVRARAHRAYSGLRERLGPLATELNLPRDAS